MGIHIPQEQSGFCNLPADLLVYIAKNFLSHSEAVTLSTTCQDVDATLREHLALALRAANKANPAMFYQACLKGYSRQVEDLIGVNPGSSGTTGTDKFPTCDPNAAITDGRALEKELSDYQCPNKIVHDITQTLNHSDTSPMLDFKLTPLCVALLCGRCRLAEVLLKATKASKHPCALSEDGVVQLVSPLHAAASSKNGGLEMIELVLRHLGPEFDVDQVNFAGLTSLWVASLNQRADADMLAHLKSAGASIEFDLGMGYTPLAHAVLNHTRFGQAIKLVQAGADINVTFYTWGVTEPKSWLSADTILQFEGLRPAEMVCHMSSGGTYFNGYGPGPADLLTSLVEHGLDIHAVNPISGRSLVEHLFRQLDAPYEVDVVIKPISICDRDRYRLLDRLLDLGADPMAADKHGNTIMEMALAQFDVQSCRVLTNHSSDAIRVLAKHWTLEAFIQTCITLDCADREDFASGLHQSNLAGGYCLEGIKLLLDLKLISREELARHPLLPQLLVAAFQCRYCFAPVCYEDHASAGLLEFLLDWPYSPEFLDRPLPDGNTLVHHALTLRNYDAIDQLMEAGANLNIPDNTGCTLAVRLLRTHLPTTAQDKEIGFVEKWFNSMEKLLPAFSCGDMPLDVHQSIRPPRTDLPYSIDPSARQRRWKPVAAEIEGPICPIHFLAEFWALVEGGEATFRLRDEEPDWGASNAVIAAIRLLERVPPSKRNDYSSMFFCLKRLLDYDILLNYGCYPLTADYATDDSDQPEDPYDGPSAAHIQALYLREACRTPSYHALEVLLGTSEATRYIGPFNRVHPDVICEDDGHTTLAWILKSLCEDSFKGVSEFRDIQETMLPSVVECIKVLLGYKASFYIKGTSPGSLSAMDYLRGLLHAPSPALPGPRWGPRREQIVLAFESGELQIVVE